MTSDNRRSGAYSSRRGLLTLAADWSDLRGGFAGQVKGSTCALVDQSVPARPAAQPARCGRAMIIMASPSGTPVPAIARLVAVDEDTVRDMLHLINQKGRMR
jgi:hypothetical protein